MKVKKLFLATLFVLTGPILLFSQVGQDDEYSGLLAQAASKTQLCAEELSKVGSFLGLRYNNGSSFGVQLPSFNFNLGMQSLGGICIPTKAFGEQPAESQKSVYESPESEPQTAAFHQGEAFVQSPKPPVPDWPPDLAEEQRNREMRRKAEEALRQVKQMEQLRESLGKGSLGKAYPRW